MRKKIIIVGALLAMLSLVGTSLWFYSGDDLDKDSIVQANRHISYTIAMKNKGNTVLESVEVFVRGPNQNTLGQKCISVNANLPFELSVDEANNQSLLFRFEHFPPFATKIIQVDADLAIYPPYNKQKQGDNLQRYLTSSPHVELSHPALKELAAKLSAATPKATTKNIFTWVSQNITKTPYSKEPKGALHSLKKKAGDCT